MLLYLSLRLVKAFRLSATPVLLCSDRRCTVSQPPHDVTYFKFELCSFFIDGENESTPRKPPQHDQKTVKNCFKYDCISHPLPLEFESVTTVLNAE